MNTITYSQRYLPHQINTKFYAVKLYSTGVGISFVCRRYHISKSSLLRWNKKFDGTKESLLDKPIDLIPSTQTPIPMKNSNGFRTIIGAILKYLSVNSTENFVQTKVIPVIPLLYTAYIGAWAIQAMLLPLKR